jgi:hypothetical protein
MSVVPSLRSTATAGFAAVALLIANPVPTSAKSCKSWGFVGQAVGQNQAQTQLLARANWASKVTAQWNAQWADWSLAASRWERCEPYRRQLRCLANGVPCKNEPGLKAK